MTGNVAIYSLLWNFIMLIKMGDSDIICIAETWLSPSLWSSQIISTNYTVYPKNRNFAERGLFKGDRVIPGVGNFVKKSLSCLCRWVHVGQRRVWQDVPTVLRMRFLTHAKSSRIGFLNPNPTICFSLLKLSRNLATT